MRNGPSTDSTLHLLRRARRLAWLAILAVLLAALAPTVSRSLAGSDAPRGWVQVCSALGVQWFHFGDGAADRAPDGGEAGGGHCPYCASHACSFLYPPTASFSLTVPGTASLHPLLHGAAPRPRFAWSATRSRAPPAA